MVRWIALIALGFVVVSGCGGLTDESAAAARSAPPSAAPSAHPPSASPSASPLPEAIAEAIRFREEFGLRADLEWVLLVAKDPSSEEGRRQYGVPLLVSERQELQTRPSRYQAVADVVTHYGNTHAEEWAGLWIDQTRGGTAVAQFTGHVEEHEAALRLLLSPNALLEVRRVRWNLAELQELFVTIREDFDRDHAWLDEIPAAFSGVGVDKADNRVKLWISSSEAGAVALINDHYGVGEDILNVESDGTGSAFLPEGTITILAVSADGKPLADLDCMAAPDSAPGLEPEDVGWATRADGRCTFTKKAMGYTVAVSTIDANGDRVILASGHVDVPPNGVASIRLVVVS